MPGGSGLVTHDTKSAYMSVVDHDRSRCHRAASRPLYRSRWQADVVAANYLLGSDSELIVFGEDGLHFRPGGAIHVVDPDAEINRGHGTTAYALCGAPVHLWRDLPFAPDAPGVHNQCARAAAVALAAG